MEHPGFFERAGPHSINFIASETSVEAGNSADSGILIDDVRPLDRAGNSDVSFFDNRKYLPQLKETAAGACFIKTKDIDHLPDGVIPLVTNTPYHAYARALRLFYPEADRSCTRATTGDTEAVSSQATLEEGVVVEPGAMVGAGAVIGRGTRIASGAFVGYRVHIGRDCYVGSNASLTHALVGDRVTIHQGAQIGQDGFGFAMGPQGHARVPQVGRVIIQDDVDIGANSCIDRGALNDTIIGQGTKIDNLVQIGHNVILGRHCVIVAQVGIGGSAVLEDFVAVGGKAAIIGHCHIGTGVQIAANSGVKDDLAAGGVYGGSPARPLKEWARELAAIRKLARKPGS